MLYPVLPHLWRRGHTPHGLGVRVAKTQGIPRAAKPASSLRLAGPSGRGSRRGAPPLCALPAVLTKVSSAEGPAPRPQRRGLGAEAPTGQQGPPQALTSMGRTVHNRRGAQTRHVQAGERQRRSPHQRLEHTTATSLLSLEFRAFCTLFVSAFSISQNNRKARFACLFLGNLPDPRGLGCARTLRYAWLYPRQIQASLGGYYGGNPQMSPKIANVFSKYFRLDPKPLVS